MGNFAAKTFKFFNRIVTISEDKQKGIIKYGANNDFPQQLVKELNESGTATACIDRVSQYVYAYGLVNEEVAAMKVNETQTLNEILSEQSRVISTFRGVALHVSRTSDGKVAYTKSIPFEQVRKTDSGDYAVNSDFGKRKVDDKKTKVYPAFKGSQISPLHISPIGEVLYYFTKRPMQYDYPIPSYYSSIEDIDADAELSKYELESVTNSFVPSGILQVVGNIDDKTEDENGMTAWDYLNDSLSTFTGAVKDATGASGRQSLLVLHAKTKEELATYTPLANDGVLNASEAATARIANKVARSFGVPSFLINLGGSVGFSTNIIADNIELFNNNILPIQNDLLQPFKMLYPEFASEMQLTQLNPIKYIDPKIMDVLTADEKRELAGYKPLVEVQPSLANFTEDLTNNLK